MMIYCARITAIGLFVADGLTDKMLITFDSNGPKDCLDYPADRITASTCRCCGTAPTSRASPATAG